MPRRRLHALLLGAAMSAASLPSSAPATASESPASAPPAPLPLDWCLERARDANPMLAIERAEAGAARERVVPAGSLDDPHVSYAASNVPIGEWDFDSTPMSGHEFGVKQKLPFPGLLGNREEAARAGSRAADARADDRDLRVAAAVEQAWAELGFAQRSLDIADRNTELLRQLTRIAETKYSVGSGRQQDVLRAQVELTRSLDDALARRAAIARREAALAGLLDLPPEVALPRTGALDQQDPLPTLEPLLARVEETSPRLAAQRESVAEAERLHRVAQLEGYPDFDLGLGYRLRERAAGDPVDGDDFVSAGVTIRLPMYRGKWRARVAERHALVRRARSAYRQALATLREGIRARHADLAHADAEVALLSDGLVPQARQSLESSRSAYQVDAVDFLSLVDSQLRLFEAELRLVRAWADRRVAFAGLEAEAGEVLR